MGLLSAQVARGDAGWMDARRRGWKDPLGTGYQLIQSFYAIGSGGLFGRGLNNSRQKLLFLTYGESDFIFAVVCEELGFFGALAILLAYGFIIYRGIRVALRCRDRFGSLLAAGIKAVDGDFEVGSTVRVLAEDNREIARGVVNYNTEDLRRLIGHRTEDFEQLVAGAVHEEVIHRDNMVLMV